MAFQNIDGRGQKLQRRDVVLIQRLAGGDARRAAAEQRRSRRNAKRARAVPEPAK